MGERRRCQLWLFAGAVFIAVEVAVESWAPTWFFLVRNMHWACWCVAFYHLGRSRKSKRPEDVDVR